MARGERRSLISLDPGPVGDELRSRLEAEVPAAAGVLERAAGKRSPAPWFAVPFTMRDPDLERLRDLSAELTANSDVLLVLGAEDLERGARALTEALAPPGGSRLRLEFVGSRWSGPWRLASLVEGLGEQRVSLIVLGGPRLDPGTVAAMRVLWQHVLRRHGHAESRRRLVLASTAADGALHEVSREEDLRLLAPPSTVSTRYSAFTPAGLLPAAAAGVDPLRLAEGARSQARSMEGQDPAECPALQVALMRILQAEDGRLLEIVGAADPTLEAMAVEGERLLSFPEEGTRRVPLPLARRLPEALHSSWLEGRLSTFQALLLTSDPPAGPGLPSAGPTPGWDGLDGSDPAAVARMVRQASAAALREQGVPCLEIRVPRLDTFHAGALAFFLQSVRGLTAVLHAADPDMKKLSAYERHFAEACAAGPEAEAERVEAGS